jgi:hypothetical protein
MSGDVSLRSSHCDEGCRRVGEDYGVYEEEYVQSRQMSIGGVVVAGVNRE